jgi:phospholipase/carboxylesterase
MRWFVPFDGRYPMTPKLISSTLVHKIRPPAEAATRLHPALIMMHGMATNENDLLGLADYLDPRFFIASVRAPFRCGEAPGSYTWYDVHAIGKDTGLPHPQQFEESYSRLVQFILDVKQHYPVDGRRVFLLGFSMGSVLSLTLSLTKPEIIRGIVAHSGYIRENTTLKFAWNRLQALSVFLAHGVDDPVIPVRLARRAQDLLSKTNADLTYKEYPIPHTISEQSLHDLSSWLEKKISVPIEVHRSYFA